MISRRSTKAGAVIEAILILAGFGLLIKGAMAGASTFRFVHAPGITEGTGTIAGASNYGFTLDVQFTASTDQMVAFAQDTLPVYHVGDQVPIIFDLANPAHAAIDKVLLVWFDTIAFSFGGLLVAGYGFSLRNKRSI
jgi:hypothetical protein